ncbi:hypothetical protein [Calothrix rhizosoleniae]|uniref:hypothetical protein n=1 Tax=Calothrix rhizosoleniae TaxID=888997 RepID=UPI0011780053|nr:hypothetical protein [Calothrix rhizosoleniae]
MNIFLYIRYKFKSLPLLSSSGSEDSTGGLPTRYVKSMGSLTMVLPYVDESLLKVLEPGDRSYHEPPRSPEIL